MFHQVTLATLSERLRCTCAQSPLEVQFKRIGLFCDLDVTAGSLSDLKIIDSNLQLNRLYAIDGIARQTEIRTIQNPSATKSGQNMFQILCLRMLREPIYP